MKKIISALIFGILVIGILGLVFAVQGDNSGNGDGIQAGDGNDGTGNGTQTNTETQIQNQGEETQLQNQVKVQSGNYKNLNGEQMQIQNENKFRLQVGGVEATSNLEIGSEYDPIQNRTRLRTQLSNGQNAEIKVMPNTASEKAIERLRLKNCNPENNCTIQLKEVGSGKDKQLAYELQAERHAKILGLFQAKMQIKAQISAENGEVIRVGKPWWAFLATEPEE